MILAATSPFAFAESSPRPPQTGVASLPGKLPEITLAFWIMKICATTLGETAGDLLSMTLKVGYAASTMILLSAFLVTLVAQMLTRRYHPALYWAVILSTSTAGTTMSDFMDRTLGLGYATGSAILAGLLAVIFVIWKCTGQPFSVEKIRTSGAEALYWSAILFSNTLGTALGDYLADDLGLGFEASAALLSLSLALLAAAALMTRLPKALLFWVAFVITRPFGATFGDYLTKGSDAGGLGFGTTGSSAILFGALLGLIIYSISKQRHAERLLDS